MPTFPDARADAASSLWRAVVERMPHAVWLIDSDGAVGFANPAAADILGYADASDLIGRPSHDTLHPTRLDGSAYPVAECPVIHPGGDPRRTGTEWFFRRDGDPLLVAWSTVDIPVGPAPGMLLSFDVVRRPTAATIAAVTPAAGADWARMYARLRRRVDERFGDPDFGPAVLAREHHLSLRAVQALFAKAGTSPAAEIREARLDHAAGLLERDASVSAASRWSGFAHEGTFVRAFTRRYGVSPARFRRGRPGDDAADLE